MSAPIADTIKAEAAKSLLERMAEKTKLVKFFRYNASAKHGVPIDAEDPINIPVPTAESKPVAENKPAPQVQPPLTQTTTTPLSPIILSTGEKSDMYKWILGTLAAIGVVGASAFSGFEFGKKDTKEVVPPTTVQQPVKNVYRESPYQYLEDQGEHLP
jgi:hypothetical protein